MNGGMFQPESRKVPLGCVNSSTQASKSRN